MIRLRVITVCLFASAMAGLCTFSGCDDNECDGKKSQNAEFRIYQELHYSEQENGKTVLKTKEVEEDTFLLYSQLTFEAMEENAESYEWTLGSDTRTFTEKKFNLVFDDIAILDENPLEIRLKIKKRPTKCFPNDEGYDSLVQLIYFINDHPLIGKYEGSDNTSPNDKYAIEISYGSRPDRSTTYWIKNLPDECNIQEAEVKFFTAFEFVIGYYNIFPGETYNCVLREKDKHIGYLKPDRKTLVIEYEFTGKDETDASKQKRIFTGIKQ
jgi:hypothetical protein